MSSKRNKVSLESEVHLLTVLNFQEDPGFTWLVYTLSQNIAFQTDTCLTLESLVVFTAPFRMTHTLMNNSKIYQMHFTPTWYLYKTLINKFIFIVLI